ELGVGVSTNGGRVTIRSHTYRVSLIFENLVRNKRPQWVESGRLAPSLDLWLRFYPCYMINTAGGVGHGFRCERRSVHSVHGGNRHSGGRNHLHRQPVLQTSGEKARDRSDECS